MSGQRSEGADPNMTPILDMVFQLITFFMLVINFKGASLDQSLKLPVLGSAQPLDWIGEFEPLMLNVDSDGNVTAYGEKVAPTLFIALEARRLKDRLRLAGKPVSNELPVPVILRADHRVRFHLVNDVITICRKHGYNRLDLSVVTQREEG